MHAIVLITFVVLLTSVAALKIGTALGLDYPSLGRAGLKALEAVGMAGVFCIANLATGMIIIAVVHGLTGRFVSHYILGDVSLLGLSLLQGMVFVSWHRNSEEAPRSPIEPVSPVSRNVSSAPSAYFGLVSRSATAAGAPRSRYS